MRLFRCLLGVFLVLVPTADSGGNGGIPHVARREAEPKPALPAARAVRRRERGLQGGADGLAPRRAAAARGLQRGGAGAGALAAPQLARHTPAATRRPAPPLQQAGPGNARLRPAHARASSLPARGGGAWAGGGAGLRWSCRRRPRAAGAGRPGRPAGGRRRRRVRRAHTRRHCGRGGGLVRCVAAAAVPGCGGAQVGRPPPGGPHPANPLARLAPLPSSSTCMPGATHTKASA